MKQLFSLIDPSTFRGSWKTTLCGIIAGVAFLARDLDILPGFEKYLEFVQNVSLCFGFFLSRDFDKRSEDHSLPPPQ